MTMSLRKLKLYVSVGLHEGSEFFFPNSLACLNEFCKLTAAIFLLAYTSVFRVVIIKSIQSEHTFF